MMKIYLINFVPHGMQEGKIDSSTDYILAILYSLVPVFPLMQIELWFEPATDILEHCLVVNQNNYMATAKGCWLLYTCNRQTLQSMQA